MVAAWRPDFTYQCAFNADPFDTVLIPLWSDLGTNYFREASAYGRGKNYDLGLPQPVAPEIVFHDPNENLNPVNPSGPFAGYIKPYRRTLMTAVYPNPANGLVGNLWNLNRWTTNNPAVPIVGTTFGLGTINTEFYPIDPTFESYAFGTEPAFIEANLGGVVPTIDNAGTPHSGTRNLKYTVASTVGLQQGFEWPSSFVPNRQYTASVWLRQSSASTHTLAVRDLTYGSDDFNRTAVNGIGTAPTGGAWTLLAGATSDYQVAPGSANITLNTVSTIRGMYLGTTSAADFNCAATFSTSQVATGGAGEFIVGGIMARYTVASGGTWYGARVLFGTNGAVSLQITSRVAGVDASLALTTLSQPYAAGTQYGVRLLVRGSNIQASMWPVAAGEAAGSISIFGTTDTSILTSAPGFAGVVCFSTSGITNAAPVVSVQEYGATYTKYGTTTTTTGAYVRLSNTFTASQFLHQMSVVNVGTAVAGTVLVDDIQLDQGASALTNVSTGSAVYPFMAPLIERWPREYLSAGYEGTCTAVGVDQMATLARNRINTEFVAFVPQIAVPAYWWPMSETNGAQSWAETSGGPSLVVVNGRGVPFTGQAQGGATIAIVGQPGAAGVATSGATATNQGISLRASGLTLPSTGATWGVSYGVWVVFTDVTNTFGFIALSNPNNGNYTAILRGGTGSLPPFSGTVYTPAAGGTSTPNAAVNYADGNAHFFVATNSLAGNSFVTNFYVDGVLATTNTATASTVFGTSAPAFLLNAFEVACGEFGGDVGDGVNATYSNAMAWRYALTSGQVGALWQAGGTGFTGESTGNRFVRHLAFGTIPSGYADVPMPVGTPAPRVSAGTTILGPPTFSPTIDLFTDSTNTTGAEGGTIWAGPDGAYVMEGRQDRWLRTAPSYVLGENVAGGEIPYLIDPDADGISFDFDPTYSYANVTVTNNNGISYTGGLANDIAKAARMLGNPANPAAAYDFQATDTATPANQANWIFYTHNSPLFRVDAVTVDPGSDASGNVWRFVLQAEIGMRITLKRRATAANNGAGLTISADYFIEQIMVNSIVMETGECTSTYQLTPIGSVSVTPGITTQPWILGDATYGVLGSTTVLGW